MKMLKEPSTYAGLATFFSGLSRVLAKDYSVEAFALILGGLFAVLLPERSGGNG